MSAKPGILSKLMCIIHIAVLSIAITELKFCIDYNAALLWSFVIVANAMGIMSNSVFESK